MLYFSMSITSISNMGSPLLLCWNNIFPNGKTNKLYTAVKFGIQVPWEALKILYQKFIHRNHAFSCKIDLVAIVVSRNGETQ